MRLLAGLSLLSLALASAAASAQTRSVAITIDDLVCANCAPINPDGSVRHGVLEAANQRLVDGLVRAHISVTGFVVTSSIDPSAGPTGRRALDLWLNAGFDLGSHSDTHPSANDLTTEQMEAEITRADAKLRPALTAHGRQLRFFRFPYNETGDTPAKHDALGAFLKDHGYADATCTIDTTDYLFAEAYARALGANDTATAARIRREYLAYSATEIDFYAALNKRVLGYEPPEVMLLHDSLLNADTLDDVLALFRARGYQFVSLTQAQVDPAYAIPETYITRYGPMWGYRWAQEKHLGKLNMTESDPPAWISSYAEGKPTPSQASLAPAKAAP